MKLEERERKKTHIEEIPSQKRTKKQKVETRDRQIDRQRKRKRERENKNEIEQEAHAINPYRLPAAPSVQSQVTGIGPSFTNICSQPPPARSEIVVWKW